MQKWARQEFDLRVEWWWNVLEITSEMHLSRLRASSFVRSSLEILREDCGFVAVWELWFSREALFMVSSSMSRLDSLLESAPKFKVGHHTSIHCLVHYRSLVWCWWRSWNEWAESDLDCTKNHPYTIQKIIRKNHLTSKFKSDRCVTVIRNHSKHCGLSAIKFINSAAKLAKQDCLEY